MRSLTLKAALDMDTIEHNKKKDQYVKANDIKFIK